MMNQSVELNRVQVPTIDDGKPRPLWSVLIPCFNCAAYLKLTLESVLYQDPGPDAMEIIVVDDCSTMDDPEAVVREVGRGRVRFIRQARNVGKVRNYESGLLASRGLLIHQLHGDDVVLTGFYDAMGSAFKLFPTAGAFFCESDYIDAMGKVTGRTGVELDETGILEDWLPRIVAAQRIQTPGMVVRRTVYEELGGFDRQLDCSEDWEMWIRLSTCFPVGFCREARSQYRCSSNNNSSRSFLNGSRGAMQRRMFQIVDSYLPQELVSEIRSERSRGQALFFSGQLPHVMKHRGWPDALLLIREILRFSHDPEVLRRIASAFLYQIKNVGR
jgi:GT2 family glycosyltransferase